MPTWILVLVLVTPAGTAMHTPLPRYLPEEQCRSLAAAYEQQMHDLSKLAGARALCLPSK